ncbi:MAG: 16S rRNA (cytosine(1402)-N(4))-methyltransferase RsmH [bacterium]|nr:16S rRNA (cytosine(1402)-N(4))-methyltransferase RsmH [bacterium]
MHIPVLLKEVMSYLDPQPNENFIDGTFGEGGHSLAILEKIAPRGKILGLEADNDLYQRLLARKTQRLIVVNDNFVNLKEIVKEKKFGPISGVLLDLGISSWHLEESQKGFSFLRNEPLMMRLDGDKSKLTAANIINDWPAAELERIFREYGEERFASKMAAAICSLRNRKPIETTWQLAEIIKRILPPSYEGGRIHPATRIFLALRIAVNRELENLERTLPQILEVLNKGGKICVITFNSLEDRIVKSFLAQESKAQPGRLKILTKKPVMAGVEEIKNNPRSRSAKLRAGIKI